jgi:hypothetical protein
MNSTQISQGLDSRLVWIGGNTINTILLRVTGFGILILVAILGPVYKIFNGFSIWFWIALVFCAFLIFWAYAAYRKLYSLVECPKCHTKMTYLRVRESGGCPKCGEDVEGKDKDKKKD